MIRSDKYSSLAASGLRTRYFPKSRIGHGLISIAPWVNITFILFFFLLLEGKFVLEPGIIVDLPNVTVSQGSTFGMTAVILSIKRTENGDRDEIIFFDDVRYRATPGDQKKLLKALSLRIKPGHESTLIIQADRKVSHGTVVDLMNMALVAGIDKVNIAAKP